MSISPPRSARRIAVELMGSSTPSCRASRSRGPVVKSCCAPSVRKSATLPLRFFPKWKSSPTTMCCTCKQSTSTRFTNACGSSVDCSSLKGTTTTASTPVVDNNSIFCSRSVSNSGADSGRTTEAGCLSKVTTTLKALSDFACSRTAAMTAW